MSFEVNGIEGHDGSSKEVIVRELKVMMQAQDRRLEALEDLLAEVARNTVPIMQLTQELAFQRKEFMSAITGRDHVPSMIMDKSIDKISSVYRGVTKTLCACLFAVVAWLTGVREIPKMLMQAHIETTETEVVGSEGQKP